MLAKWPPNCNRTPVFPPRSSRAWGLKWRQLRGFAMMAASFIAIAFLGDAKAIIELEEASRDSSFEPGRGLQPAAI